MPKCTSSCLCPCLSIHFWLEALNTLNLHTPGQNTPPVYKHHLTENRNASG